jgi:hypothetical protein
MTKIIDRILRYYTESVNAVFPKNIIRRVQINPMTLKAQWVSYYNCVLQCHNGWVEWDDSIGYYRFCFDDLEEELRFIKDYTPRRKTYRDRSRMAIATRAMEGKIATARKEKIGNHWE